MEKKLNQPKYSFLQVLGVVASILLAVYMNRHKLMYEEGWRDIIIYTCVSLFILMTGVRSGAFKEILRKAKEIKDSGSSAEVQVKEYEAMMVVAAAGAGLAWERLNESEKKRLLKQELKKKKKLQKLQEKEE